MGNILCPLNDGAHLAAMARDICPFPNYNPSPHFMNTLTVNSSHYLKEHYTAVQSSLSPKQLEDFTQSLRTTFGREGKVTLGGIGVVALSLAVLFDTIAKQVRGDVVTDFEPIPSFFVKEPRGYYPPHVYTMSKCLRLIPHIANNPTRMRQETERCSTQLKADDQEFNQQRINQTSPYEDTNAINLMMGYIFQHMLTIYLAQVTNSTWEKKNDFNRDLVNISFSLNCDFVAADKVFLAEVDNSDNYTKEAFQRCKPEDDSEETSLIAYIAKDQFEKFLISPIFGVAFSHDEILGRREDFDLKANALGKWA